MDKISIIGLFCEEKNIFDGQSIKTRLVGEELECALGNNAVSRIDTYGWKKRPFSLLKKSILAVWQSSHVIFMTDAGGIKVFPWLLLLLNACKTCSLHYVVVGGWLIHFVKKHAFIRSCLKRFDCIYVETTVMKQALEEIGFQNIVLMPNFKRIDPIDNNQLAKQDEAPFRFCTFSRVMQEKGIDDAVKAVCDVNAHFGKTVCTLDIYGQVDPKQTEWFYALQSSFTPEIQYCGVIDYDKSVDVLKDYFALLFPTEFYTEGIPGTIIDAYAAGIPVIAAQWESFSDVIDHGLTGIGYPFEHQESLKDILVSLVEKPEIVNSMKATCLKKAKNYLPDSVMNILLSRLS